MIAEPQYRSGFADAEPLPRDKEHQLTIERPQGVQCTGQVAVFLPFDDTVPSDVVVGDQALGESELPSPASV